MMRENFFSLPIQNTKCEVLTSNGVIILNKSITIPYPVTIFLTGLNNFIYMISQKIMIDDLLIDRKLLSDGQSIINYKNSQFQFMIKYTQ